MLCREKLFREMNCACLLFGSCGVGTINLRLRLLIYSRVDRSVDVSHVWKFETVRVFIISSTISFESVVDSNNTIETSY